LAEVLIQEKKYPEAEDALLKAYELLDRDSAKAPAALLDANARLISLYEAWGRSGQADEWKRKLAGAIPPSANSADFAAPAKLLCLWRCEGDGRDSAGTNHGVLFSSIAATSGVNGLGLHFNGIDGGVEIPNAPTPAAFSISAWVRFDRLDSRADVPGSQFLVFRKNSQKSGFEGFALMKTREEADRKDRLALELTSAGRDNTKIYTPAITTNVFYHVMGTFDGSWARLYLDGVQCSWSYHPYPLDYGSRPMFFGTSGEDYDGRFAGTLNEVSFYDWALSPAQVGVIYKARGRIR
jgi:hypothetical protein